MHPSSTATAGVALVDHRDVPTRSTRLANERPLGAVDAFRMTWMMGALWGGQEREGQILATMGPAAHPAMHAYLVAMVLDPTTCTCLC